MKVTMLSKSLLSKSLTAIALASVATTSMAATSVAEATGEKLTNVTDTVYTALTGKTVQDVEVNHPVSLYDYNEASSEYEDAYVNGSLNINDSKDSDTSYNAALGLDYEKVISTPNANTKYEADLNGLVADTGEEDSERTENYNGKASVTYDRYFNPEVNDAFWYGEGQVRIQQEEPEDYAGIENPEVKIGGGLGYGRVVNVTPMAHTMRLIEALVENGSISSVPSAATYQQIATIISKKDSYESKYGADRYAQYWVSDIANTLGTKLDANAIIRAYEVLENESISTRKYGWEVRGGAGIVANNFAGESGNPYVNLQANYYKPFSNRTQFSNEAEVSFELDDDDNSYVFDNDMGLTYELSDRVDWENSWNLNYRNNENSADVTTNTLSSAFLYEINNSLDYETRLDLSHVDVEGEESEFDKGLFMGVKYRLK